MFRPRSLLAILIILTSPLAAAAPDVSGVITDQADLVIETATTYSGRVVGDASAAADAVIRAEGELTEYGFAAAFDASDLTFDVLGATTGNALGGAAVLSEGAGGLGSDAAGTALSGYRHLNDATGHGSAGALDAAYSLSGGTGANLGGLGVDAVDAIDIEPPVFPLLTKLALDATRDVSDIAFDALSSSTTRVLAGTSGAASNATTLGTDGTALGVGLASAAATDVATAFSAASSDVLGGANAASAAGFNLASGASDLAFVATFGALAVAEDAASGAGTSVFTATYGGTDAVFDAENRATRAGLDAGYESTERAFALEGDITSAAFSASYALVSAAFTATDPATGQLIDLVQSGLLVPCDPATGGGARLQGEGECMGAGIVAFELPAEVVPASGPAAAPATPDSANDASQETAESGEDDPAEPAEPLGDEPEEPATANSVRPPSSSKDPRNCASGEYGFAATKRDAQGYPRIVAKDCIKLIPGTGVTYLWSNGQNTARLDYDSTASQAKLTVTDGPKNFDGFFLVVSGTEFQYGSASAVPQTVVITLTGVHAGLTERTSLDERLRLAFEASERPSWIRFDLYPDTHAHDDRYRVQLGRFHMPGIGQETAGTAPTKGRIDIRLGASTPTAGKVALKWTESGVPTPVAVTLTKDGSDTPVYLNSLPATADLTLHWDNRIASWGTVLEAKFWGSLEFGTSRVARAELVVGDIALTLMNVPSLHQFRYHDVQGQPGFVEPCDRTIWNMMAQHRNPSGERQACVTASLTHDMAELQLAGGAVKLWNMPAGDISLTMGPLGAISYKEVFNTGVGAAQKHASLSVGKSELFGDVKGVELTNMLSMTYAPGATLGGGGESNGCGSSDKRDDLANRPEMYIEARFTGQGKAVASVYAGGKPSISLSASGLARISSNGGYLDMDFGSQGGGIDSLDIDMSNGCEKKVASGYANRLTSLRLHAGSAGGTDSAGLMLTRISGLTYASIHIQADSETPCADLTRLVGDLDKQPSGEWKVRSNVDFYGSACGSKARNARISGTGEYNHILYTLKGRVYAATYALVE